MKYSKYFFSALAVSLTLSFIGCEKKVGKNPVETPPPAVSACDTITYNKHIKNIMAAHCVRCHGSANQQGNTLLETYDQVKAKAEGGRIKARVIDGTNGFMPQDSGKLEQKKLDLINCWLNNQMKQ